MPKDRIQGQLKITYNKPQPLDQKEFAALADILYEAFKGNNTACATVLGVSVITWKGWLHTPPKWPYWNIILRLVLKDVLTSLAARKGSQTKKHKDRLTSALRQLPHNDPLPNMILETGYDYAASVQHLRQLLIRKGMFKDQIFTTANMGGFSKKSLENASRTLGVIKTQEGFGDHKRSWWRLPNEDDED